MQSSRPTTWLQVDLSLPDWVSGTRVPSQIHTDLTDLADGPNESVLIGDLWNLDICKLQIQPKNR